MFFATGFVVTREINGPWKASTISVFYELKRSSVFADAFKVTELWDRVLTFLPLPFHRGVDETSSLLQYCSRGSSRSRNKETKSPHIGNKPVKFA